MSSLLVVSLMAVVAAASAYQCPEFKQTEILDVTEQGNISRPRKIVTNSTLTLCTPTNDQMCVFEVTTDLADPGANPGPMSTTIFEWKCDKSARCHGWKPYSFYYMPEPKHSKPGEEPPTHMYACFKDIPNKDPFTISKAIYSIMANTTRISGQEIFDAYERSAHTSVEYSTLAASTGVQSTTLLAILVLLPLLNAQLQ